MRNDVAETWGIGLVERGLLEDLVALWEGPLRPERLHNIELGLRSWMVSLVITVSTRHDVWDLARANEPESSSALEEVFSDHLLDYELSVPGTRIPLEPIEPQERSFLAQHVSAKMTELVPHVLPKWITKEGEAFAYIDGWYRGLPQTACDALARTMRGWEELTDSFGPDSLGGHAVLHRGPGQHAEYLLQAHRAGVSVYGSSPTFEVCQEHIFSAWPAHVFSSWHVDYDNLIRRVRGPGLGISLPPLVAIVLSRAAKRDDIPLVLRDLRDEYAAARRSLWSRLAELWSAPTLAKQHKVAHELNAAAEAIVDAAFPERIDVLDVALGLAQLTPSGVAQAARSLRARDDANTRVSALTFAKKLSVDIRGIENARVALRRHLSDAERRDFGMC